MAKLEFNKDPNRKKTFKKVEETHISEPKKTFSTTTTLDNTPKPYNTTPNPKMGRPRKNKTYSTIRIQRHTVNRINALQNTLNFDTQDDLIINMLDKLETVLDSEQKTMLDMYMKTYTAKEKRQNS
ncbi:Replication-associated protein RepC (plasmid) [Leuconostoc mesenteroides]|uniref:Replication-associated protein RepC n=1 Tax=Leuconostoc mesenteroides TaxID=1245 RepID=UPI0021E59FC6|nr:Replication-associated protein RepC [Leuconostoc mesenteroides]MCV2530853.1 Replication-associated protein RepC [Leuconostoc mesenteroides]WVI91312.1 Replication-associated protein RepC [Leuconostoc mesenteroides]